MYEELIKKFNPKPELNLKWYKNEDLYSEGEIEDIIIKLIAENEPEQYVQCIAENYCWSTYYHLTHIRKNILNWYPFAEDASVLEIGCGMGAITGVLCDRCREVTAVELSQKRAIGTLLRCREKENLEIIVGNLNDIQFEKKFDYITLIGVLEYQGSYTDTNNPYLDFLKKVKSLLKPEGKLLIAIENQYGLKYWCGAREDHTGCPFDGMNQYTLSTKKVRTFSKATLELLAREAGFKKTFFYYPMPDYKLPTVIYSQDCLPHNANMMNMQYYYVPDSHTLVAQEEKIYKDIIENNVFPFFSNSFLLECTEMGEIGEVTFASLSSKRLPEYQVGTRFTNRGKVEKFLLFEEKGQRHLLQMVENEVNLRGNGLNVWNNRLIDMKLVSAYSKAPTLEDVLLDAYRGEDTDKIYNIWERVYEEILGSSEEAPWEENILYTFELGIAPEREKYGPILKTAYIDMILRNAFFEKGQIYWFDQEWILENTPAKYVMYRALTQFYSSYGELDHILKLSVMVDKYDMLNCWRDFENLEKLFFGAVMDQVHMAEYNGFNRDVANDLIRNINRLIN